VTTSAELLVPHPRSSVLVHKSNRDKGRHRRYSSLAVSASDLQLVGVGLIVLGCDARRILPSWTT
jgi:hypothetical protein